MTNALSAISPLDGRYSSKVLALNDITSEFGLIKYRVLTEIEWVKALANTSGITELPALSDTANTFLDNIVSNFDIEQADKVKQIEATTNHDVKAVEYYLKEQFNASEELKPYSEFIHFACTSEDINNLSYGLMMKDTLHAAVLPKLQNITKLLTQYAHDFADQAMLSRTHGQTASPTTVGKEFANVVHRLKRQFTSLRSTEITGKLNGATGNFNAHYAAYPEVNWPEVSNQFITSLGLTPNSYTTQIEPHDNLAEIFHNMMRINTILIDLARDIWGYISLNYFKQKVVKGEVGSSTMPHKVNPIDFENAEGNFGLANALMDHMANKLPTSRWQRDLTDSTVLRNIGSCAGYTLLGFESLIKGLNKLELNQEALNKDLNNNWEVLGEALQTVMRRYHIDQPYEKLKALTRGKRINQQDLQAFIGTLELNDDIKAGLKQLTPASYIGIANTLAKDI